jgi:hypothetical protein
MKREEENNKAKRTKSFFRVISLIVHSFSATWTKTGRQDKVLAVTRGSVSTGPSNKWGLGVATIGIRAR